MKHVLMYIALVAVLVSCSDEKRTTSTKKMDPFVGLASPIQLEVGETRIPLIDYLGSGVLPDSVSADVPARLLDGDLILTPAANMPIVSTLDLYFSGERFSIPVMKSEKVLHRFEFDPQGRSISKIQIKSEVAAWDVNALPMRMDNGKYIAEFESKPGIFQYKMVIDGVEVDDWNNPDKAENGIGGYNNLMFVGPPESDVDMRLKAHTNGGTLLFTCLQAQRIIALIDNEQIELAEIDGGFAFDWPESKSSKSGPTSEPGHSTSQTVLMIFSFH